MDCWTVLYSICVYRSLKPGWRIQMNMVSWWCRLVQEWSICQMTLLRNLLEPWAVYPRESSGGTAIHSFIHEIAEPFYQQIRSPAYHSIKVFFYHKVSIGNWYCGGPLISLWLQLSILFSISKPVNPHSKWSDGLLDFLMVSKCKTSWIHFGLKDCHIACTDSLVILRELSIIINDVSVFFFLKK